MPHRRFGVEAHTEQRGRASDCPSHRPAGWSPSFWNRASNNVPGPAIRTSAANAKFRPAPTAAPLTAAMVGNVQLPTAMKPS